MYVTCETKARQETTSFGQTATNTSCQKCSLVYQLFQGQSVNGYEESVFVPSTSTANAQDTLNLILYIAPSSSTFQQVFVESRFLEQIACSLWRACHVYFCAGPRQAKAFYKECKK